MTTLPDKPNLLQKILEVLADVSTEWYGWPPSPKDEKPKDEERLGRQIARAVKVLVILSLITLTAYYVAYLFVSPLRFEPLNETERRIIQLGAPGLTVLGLITAFQDLRNIFINLRQYVRNKQKSDWFAEYVKYSATSLALFASYFVFASSLPKNPLPQLVVTVPTPPIELSRPTYLAIGGEGDSDHFPFLFELADGPPTWSKGVSLSREQKIDIKKLASTLKACAVKSQRVAVKVIGYADANDFAQAEQKGFSSTELNRQTANRRAASLHEELSRALGTTSLVDVEPVFQWSKDKPFMVDSPRYFNAKKLKDTGYQDQGLFNRRAEVELVKAGACQRLKVLPAGK